jgi:hypothetical protein
MVELQELRKWKIKDHMMIIVSVVIKMQRVILACIDTIVHMNCF